MNLPTRQSDPSGLFAAIGGLVAAILSLVAVFVPLPPGLTEAVLGLIATGGAVWTALAIRRHAWSPVTHYRDVQAAGAMTPHHDESGRIDPVAAIAALAAAVLAVVLIWLV